MVQDVTQRFLLTVEEAAHRLSISRMGIYRLFGTGELLSIKVGGSRRISVTALEAYIAHKEEEARAETLRFQ